MSAPLQSLVQHWPARPQEDLIHLYLLQHQQSSLEILRIAELGADIHELLAILLGFLHSHPHTHVEVVVAPLFLKVGLLQGPEDDHAVTSYLPSIDHQVAVLRQRKYIFAVEFQLGEVNALINSVDDCVLLDPLVPQFQVEEGFEKPLGGEMGGDEEVGFDHFVCLCEESSLAEVVE